MTFAWKPFPFPRLAATRFSFASTPAASVALISKKFPPAPIPRPASSGTKPPGSSPPSAKPYSIIVPATASWSFITTLPPMLLLSEQDLCPVRHLQESRLHRRLRALRRWFRRIRPRHGLDCRTRYRPHPRRHFLRASLLRRTGQHLHERN